MENKKNGSKFGLEYSITGKQERKNKVVILNPYRKEIFKVNDRNKGKFSEIVKKEGKYTVCFQNLSYYEITVSFHFYSEGREKKLITVDNIDSLDKGLKDIRKRLNNADYSIKTNAIARDTHSLISKQIISKINFYTALKLFILVSFSFLNVYMVTSMFKNVKVVNKISMDSSSNSKNLDVL